MTRFFLEDPFQVTSYLKSRTGVTTMTLLRPDQTFYPSPQMACEAPAEKFGYVATLNYGRNDRPDAGVQPNGAGVSG